MKKIALFVFAALPVLAFAKAESLLGHMVSYEGVTFQVTSGGCTKKSDFTVVQLESYPVQLRLERNKPDFCEAYLPYGEQITFSWSELGLSKGSEFTIANPEATLRVQ